MTSSTSTTPVLPDGYDDPDALTYVPPQLREHWQPLDTLAAMTAVDVHAGQARVDVLMATPSGRETWARHARRHRIERAPMKREWWAVAGVSHDSPAPPLDDAVTRRAVHLAGLAAAGERARLAAQAADQVAEHAARACPVCGGHRPRLTDDLCPPCTDVAAVVRTRAAAAALLADGRTREAAVTAWVGARP